jgi:hypothetical protein
VNSAKGSSSEMKKKGGDALDVVGYSVFINRNVFIVSTHGIKNTERTYKKPNQRIH